MKIVLEISEDAIADLQPLLEMANRPLKNYVESIVLLAIRHHKAGTDLMDLKQIGTVVKGK